MKYSRAIHHLEALAQSCAEVATGPSSIFAWRVTELWAVGDVLGRPGDIEWVTVALAVELSVDEVPWLCQPPGAEHWANATRMSKNPIVGLWRSVHAPVWNHYIDRPALVWDIAGGVAEETLAALRAGQGDTVRSPAPSSEELRARLDDELAVSLRALRGRTRDFEDRRWKGNLAPIADDLWRASDGYLDVLDAIHGLAGRD